MHLFLPYLINDSLNGSFFQTPLRDANLQIGPIGQFHFHFIMPVMPDKAVFVSAVLLWETTILQRQKWHPVYFHLNQRENLLMVKFSQVCTCN